MIRAPDGSVYAEILAIVRTYPGEYSDRPIWVGKICVAGVPEVGDRALPTRWPERMREAGMLRPARIRLAAHVQEARARYAAHVEVRRMVYQSDQERAVWALLWTSEDGLLMGELVAALGGDEAASGALKETLQGLYRAGLATPPGAVWAV